MARMMFHCTHARDDPERAILPFVAATVAAQAGQDAIVLLSIEGAWLGRRGEAEGVACVGLPRLLDLIGEFVENGGVIWACGACTKPRGITGTDLVPGAKIVTAANVVELLASGVGTLSF